MLKKIYGIFVLLLISISLNGQAVKKIRISELISYLDHCDHPLIVNFWATTCEPCIKEIPYLQSITSKYHNKQVELLLVSMDMPSCFPSKLISFAKEKSIAASILFPDNEDASGNFYQQMDTAWSGGIPASLFLNHKTHYRRFFDRQLTDLQVEWYIKEMIDP